MKSSPGIPTSDDQLKKDNKETTLLDKLQWALLISQNIFCNIPLEIKSFCQLNGSMRVTLWGDAFGSISKNSL